MAADPSPSLPLPPELAEPEPGADAWVERVAAELVALAESEGMSPADAAALARPWRVTDDGSAEWAMRHVVKAQAELARLRQQAAGWTARIEAWFDHRAKPLEATVAFMSAHLERYALEVREASKGKTKTVVLPSGAVPTTSKGPRVEITDAKAARAWAVQHAPSALQPREPELLVSLLRQHVKPVQLVTQARFTHSCGCVYEQSDPEGLEWPDVGTEVECPKCGEAALLGRVDVEATRWIAKCTVDDSWPEGVDVDPGGVTAKVVPAP